jgi:hypothetical protein
MQMVRMRASLKGGVDNDDRIECYAAARTQAVTTKATGSSLLDTREHKGCRRGGTRNLQDARQPEGTRPPAENSSNLGVFDGAETSCHACEASVHSTSLIVLCLIQKNMAIQK